MAISEAGFASRNPPSAPRRETTIPAVVSRRRICSRYETGMSYRATTSCRLHHSPAESPMASRARQAYSLAVVMCME